MVAEHNVGVVFPEPGEVALEERPVPEPGAEEVLIETKRTLVSTGTELTMLQAEYPPGSAWDRDFPRHPGYNNVGEVLAVGENVDEAMIGERVGCYGDHAQYVTAVQPSPLADPFQTYRLIPEGIADEEAVFFTFAEIVMNAVRRGDVRWGETVAVYGLGLLGQFAVRFAHFAGAAPVVGLDLADHRLDYLPAKARVIGLNPGEKGWKEQFADATARGEADVVIEATGNPDAITQEFRILREQGRLVLLSSPHGKTPFDFHDHCNAGSYAIIGAHNRSHPLLEQPQTPWTHHRHAELFFSLLADGTLSVAELVSHRYSYERALDAYDLLVEDRTQAMGVMFKW